MPVWPSRGPQDGSILTAPQSARLVPGAGQPLDTDTRQWFEPRFAASLADVRVHQGVEASAAAAQFDANAYTTGSHIVFGAGQYEPGSSRGRHLLAHELTHVFQQAAVPQAQATVHRACGSKEVGAVGGCRPQEDIDILPADPVFKFVVNCDTFQPGEEAKLRALAAGITSSDRIEIHGYASEEGTPAFNLNLSCLRAHTALNILVSEGVPLSQVFGLIKHGAIAGQREDRRSVQIIRFPPGNQGVSLCDELVAGSITSVHDYINLVRCAEAAMPQIASSPQTMLSLLRQLYFGPAWSRNPTSLWQQIIPCGVTFAVSPEGQMGTPLFNALKNAKDVGGIDISHPLTGLEAQFCPQADINIPVPILGSIKLGMDSVAFATWGGDIAAAAADAVFEQEDLLKYPDMDKIWANQAGDGDLEGDIDAFMLAKIASGAACRDLPKQVTSLTQPVSQLLYDYYTFAGTAGTTRKDRFRCFVRALGGRIRGNKITNRFDVESKLLDRVASATDRLHSKRLHDEKGKAAAALKPVFADEYGRSIEANAMDVLTRFFDWLEARL